MDVDTNDSDSEDATTKSQSETTNIISNSSNNDNQKKRKREFTRWGPIPRKKRWGKEQKTIPEPLQHIVSNSSLSPKQTQIFLLKLN